MSYKPTPATRARQRFAAVCSDIEAEFVYAPVVKSKKWQAVDAPQGMVETLNFSFFLDLEGLTVSDMATAIEPNIPWANDHFVQERVSGQPKNPGKTWRQWPYARSADKHRREGEEDPQFDHSYAERYWPKYAGKTPGGLVPVIGDPPPEVNRGIRSPYGDLHDVLKIMKDDPNTRQAFLPIWFPEDAYGAAHEGRRVPCTLGYHFIHRRGKLHCVYYIRSCDYIRHFRDDVYLTARLMEYMAVQLRICGDSEWRNLQVGRLTMHITSLHMFEQDRENMFRRLEG